MPTASRIEEEIKNNFKSAKVTLEGGDGGIFDIFIDGEMIFSKKGYDSSYGRFPEDGEITALISQYIS